MRGTGFRFRSDGTERNVIVTVSMAHTVHVQITCPGIITLWCIPKLGNYYSSSQYKLYVSSSFNDSRTIISLTLNDCATRIKRLRYMRFHDVATPYNSTLCNLRLARAMAIVAEANRSKL